MEVELATEVHSTRKRFADDEINPVSLAKILSLPFLNFPVLNALSRISYCELSKILVERRSGTNHCIKAFLPGEVDYMNSTCHRSLSE